MTKKHFEAFAKQMRAALEYGTPADQVNFAARAFATLAKQENPQFDYVRFMSACGF